LNRRKCGKEHIELGSQVTEGSNFKESHGRGEFPEIVIRTRFLDPAKLGHIVTSSMGGGGKDLREEVWGERSSVTKRRQHNQNIGQI